MARAPIHSVVWRLPKGCLNHASSACALRSALCASFATACLRNKCPFQRGPKRVGVLQSRERHLLGQKYAHHAKRVKQATYNIESMLFLCCAWCFDLNTQAAKEVYAGFPTSCFTGTVNATHEVVTLGLHQRVATQLHHICCVPSDCPEVDLRDNRKWNPSDLCALLRCLKSGIGGNLLFFSFFTGSSSERLFLSGDLFPARYRDSLRLLGLAWSLFGPFLKDGPGGGLVGGLNPTSFRSQMGKVTNMIG